MSTTFNLKSNRLTLLHPDWSRETFDVTAEDVTFLQNCAERYLSALELHKRRLEILPSDKERERAIASGGIADILQARGELDEALRIRTEEQLSVYERLGDVRSRAVTQGKIADIKQARGELDEALRIRT